MKNDLRHIKHFFMCSTTTQISINLASFGGGKIIKNLRGRNLLEDHIRNHQMQNLNQFWDLHRLDSDPNKLE